MPSKTVNFDILVISLIALTVLVLSAVNLSRLASSANRESSKVLSATVELVNEKKYWEETLFNNPTYFPGWIELSKIEEALGNIEAAKQALLKAKAINPNY